MKGLSKAIEVAFDKLHLDPNNPRLGRTQPGYDAAEELFPHHIQKELEELMQDIYPISDLGDAIVEQGWVPIDSILVWEHPKKKGHYVVVEGNSRLTALRLIRRSADKVEERYKKWKKKKGADPEALAELEANLEKLKQVIADTKKVQVVPVKAKDTEELQDILPRLLGVRHINPAQQWGPYAENLYIYNLYRKMFRDTHGPKTALGLDREIIRSIGEIVSLGITKTRRKIQAVAAFEHFKVNFEDRIPKSSPLKAEDHYFFELLLQNSYAADQFGFGRDDLKLTSEMEDVFFKWSFAKVRSAGKRNPNIFYKAESIRLWQQMKRYDDQNGTSFASRLDVEDPDKAVSIERIEAEYTSHKARTSPIDAIEELLRRFDELRFDQLRSQAKHLVPLVKRVKSTCEDALKMLGGVRSRK